ADLDQIADWLAGHPRKDKPADEDQTAFAKGYRLFADTCMKCHSYKGKPKDGPDFTGYGDAQWIHLMITSPDLPMRYGPENAMPAFRNLEGPLAENGQIEYASAVKKEVKDLHFINLSDFDRELIVRFILKDDRVVFGGDAIGPPKPEK